VFCCLLAKVCGIRPKLVVRQVDHGAAASVLIYNLVNKKVLAGITANDIQAFNPENTLYLYEPVTSKNAIPVTGLNTITTVSPNSDRYDEYSKKSMVVFTQMPKYSLVELLHIGREMRADPDNANHPENLEELYSDESIKSRYYKFGGSIRRVIPGISDDNVKHQREFEQVILRSNVGSVRNSMQDTQVLSHTSSYIVQWTAPKTLRDSSEIATTADVSSEQFEPVKWQYNFRALETGWASPEAEHRIKLRFADLSLDEIRQELKGIYLKNGLDPLVASYFEIVAVHTFQEMRKLHRRFDMEAKYSDMAVDTLYYPPDTQFPACEAYYKSQDGRLHLLQASKRVAQKSCTNGAFAQFLSRIEYPKQTPDPLSIELVYCRMSSESGWLLVDGQYTKVLLISFLCED
jgi:hypothetical protein